MQVRTTQPKEWSIMCYNPASTNTGLTATKHLLDLETLGPDRNTDLVALNYRGSWLPEMIPGNDKSKMGAHLYRIEKHDHPSPSWVPEEYKPIARFVTAQPGKLQSPSTPVKGDLANPETLKKFLLESMAKYPAKHHALIFTAHGAGLGGQGVVGESRISNEQLGKVLDEVAAETGKKLDLLNLDTCFGATLESLHPLRNSVETVVSSAGTIAMCTQPVKDVVQSLQNSLNAGEKVSSQDLGRMFVETSRFQPLSNFHTPTLSALDASKLEKVGDCTSALHTAILEEKIPPEKLNEILDKAQRLDYSGIPRSVYLWDLGSVAKEMAAGCDNPRVQELARELSGAVQSAVIAEQHAEPGKESMLTRLARLPFGNENSDVSKSTGLGIFYDREQQTMGSRLPLLKDTELGKKLRVEEFFTYLSQVYTAKQAGKSKLQVKREELALKQRKLESKIAKAVPIPFLVPATKWALRVGATMAAGFGLSALGVPVGAVMGAYLAGTGVLAAGKAALGLARAQDGEKRAEAAGNLALAGTMAAFGGVLMEVVPQSLAWPIAGVALAAHAGKFLGKHFAHKEARRQHEALQARFQAAPTIGAKLDPTKLQAV